MSNRRRDGQLLVDWMKVREHLLGAFLVITSGGKSGNSLLKSMWSHLAASSFFRDACLCWAQIFSLASLSISCSSSLSRRLNTCANTNNGTRFRSIIIAFLKIIYQCQSWLKIKKWSIFAIFIITYLESFRKLPTIPFRRTRIRSLSYLKYIMNIYAKSE